MLDEDINESQSTDATTLAKLRFLADVAIDTLGEIEEESTLREDSVFRIVPEDASPEMLRTLLRLAVPVLNEAGHWELAEQIQEVLREES